MKIFSVMLIAGLWVTNAWAQTAVTVGTTAKMGVFLAQTRQKLSVCNQSSTANVAVSFSSTVPAVNSAGSYIVPALYCLNWGTVDLPPQEQVNVIADTASTPVTMDQR